jgi:putative oxidoreductase
MRPYGATVLRLCAGVVFLAHGAQKLFGLWGGPGLTGTTALFTTLGLPYPYPLALLVAVTEFAGGALLIFGGLTRWVALALAIDMAVAIWKVHYTNGFFLNARGGQGSEFAMVLLGAMLCLILTGPGALSWDEWRDSSAEAMRAGRARARKV